MEEYAFEDIIKYLKVVYQNIFTLHHNIVSPNFYGDHEKLGEYYEKVQEYIDELVELADTMNLKEPSIIESINYFRGKETILTSKAYTANESFALVKDYFNKIITILEIIKEKQVGYVKSKLEEIQYYFNIEANYKIKRLIIT